MKIISSKSDGKTYYVERYEDDQFGFVLNKKDATRFDIHDVDRILRRLHFDCPNINELKVLEEPMSFRIVAK
jgi:hypothetical protein